MSNRAIVYYACNTHLPEIDEACRAQLSRSAESAFIDTLIAVSLNKDLAFGSESITMHGTRSPLMMHKQVVAGLERVPADWTVFLAESDVLYHPSHFDFLPADADTFYYNTNVWRTRYPDGHCIWTDDLRQVSGVCAKRETLLDFYAQRLAQMERDGFNRHYEPGIHQTVGSNKVTNRLSAFPNIDIRHDKNITLSKWSPAEFRNPKYAKGWREADGHIDGWGQLSGRLPEYLKELL